MPSSSDSAQADRPFPIPVAPRRISRESRAELASALCQREPPKHRRDRRLPPAKQPHTATPFSVCSSSTGAALALLPPFLPFPPPLTPRRRRRSAARFEISTPALFMTAHDSTLHTPPFDVVAASPPRRRRRSSSSASATKRSPSPRILLSGAPDSKGGVQNITRKVIRKLEELGNVIQESRRAGH